jgi:hypothetical protein
MARLSIAVLLLAALAAGGCLSTADEGAPRAATAPAPLDGARPLAAVSGADLVRRLEDRKARAAAFGELALRTGDEQDASLELADVIICPQGEGKPPLHVVLRKLHARPTSNADFREYGYPVEDPEELFRPPSRCVLQKRNELVIFAFVQDGKAVMPFGGNNMLDDGIIADINGDGLIERADHCDYGISGIKHTQVLEVCSLYERPRPLLSVLYNWGETEDWGYQFVDRDGDGIAEIELGPVTGAGEVKPKAIFTWDKATKTYVGPEGKAGDHFRVLRADDTYKGSLSKELDRIEKEVPVFAADPDAPASDAAQALKKPQAAPAPPPARPYKYASLKGLTNPEIAAYMGSGGVARDLQPEEDGEMAAALTHLPKNFWTMPPRQAALELVDANRAPWHRKVFLLAVDGRDGKTPPETCSIYFACHFEGDFAEEQFRKYFLRVDPQGSYLAYACASEKDAEPDDLWARRSSYDLRRIEMKYEEARHFADVIWWLQRVRSWTDAEDSGWSEGGAGEDAGALRMTWGQGGEFRELGTVWQGHVASRWNGPWGPDALVNVAAGLFQCALPERLGARWTGQEPLPGPDEAASNRWASPFEEDTPPQLRAWRREQARLHVARLIEFFSADESRLAHAALRAAVRAAGDFALAEFAPQIRAIERQLPPPARPLPTLQQLQEQESKAIFEMDGDKDRKAAERLSEVISAMKTGTGPEAAREQLRQSAGLALRKIEAAGDPKKLLKWAQSAEEGWPWALLQLRALDTQRYVTALARRLTNPGTDYEMAELLNAIAKVAPARAAELAAEVPAARLGKPHVASRVEFLKADGIEDEARRVDALIKVLLGPDIAWKEKRDAVQRLVPRDAPLRRPDKKIDDALVALLAMAPPEGNTYDDYSNTITDACESLALRGRVERFDDIARLLGDKRFRFRWDEILSSLTRLACSGGPDLRARMVQILRPNLKQTGFDIRAIIGCIYALDLRELRPDLERIATAGPEDCSGEECLGSTGKVAPITERYHLARKAVAAWNEEDPLARAKLLIAFWWNEARFRNVARPAIQKQLQELAAGLSASDKRQVLDFMAWYATYPLAFDPYEDRREALADMAELGATVKRIFRTEKSGSL